MVRYPDFLLAGIYGVCYGVTPEGEILLLHDLSTRDLYALDGSCPRAWDGPEVSQPGV